MIEPRTDEHTPPRSEEEPKTPEKAGPRTLVSYIPVTAAVLGSTLVIGSVVLIYGPNDVGRLVFVTFGVATPIVVASYVFAILLANNPTPPAAL